MQPESESAHRVSDLRVFDEAGDSLAIEDATNALVAFLESLTDLGFLNDPAVSGGD